MLRAKGWTVLKWSGRMDLNHRPPGPEPGALARLRYAPTIPSGPHILPKRNSQINIALMLRARPMTFLA